MYGGGAKGRGDCDWAEAWSGAARVGGGCGGELEVSIEYLIALGSWPDHGAEGPQAKGKRAAELCGQRKEGAGRPAGVGSRAPRQLALCGSAAPGWAGTRGSHACA